MKKVSFSQTIFYCVFFYGIFFLSSHLFALQTDGLAFRKIAAAFAAGSYEYVISEADSFLQNRPFTQKRCSVLLFKAQSLYFCGRKEQSLALFKKIDTEFSAQEPAAAKKARYYIAVVLTEQGKHRQALTYLYDLVQKPFDDNETDKTVLLYAARSLAALGSEKNLIAVLNQYVKKYAHTSSPEELFPLISGLWFGMGRAAFYREDIDKAQEYFRRADLQGETEYSSLYQAFILYLQKKHEDATLVLEKAKVARDSPLLFYFYALKGILYGRLGQRQKSEFFSSEAWKLKNGKDSQFVAKTGYWYAVSLFEKKEYAQAARVLSQCSFADSYGMHARLLYAQALYLSGDTEKALDEFVLLPHSDQKAAILFKSGRIAEAAEVARFSGDTYLEGLCAYTSGDWETAVQKLLPQNALSDFFSGAIAQTANDKTVWALYYAALALYRCGRYAESRAAMERFLTAPVSVTHAWNAYMVCAMSALQEGEQKTALENALSAVAYASSQDQKKDATLLAAGLYREQKEYERALDILKPLAVGYTKENLDLRMQIAAVYAVSGKSDDAFREYETIAEYFPNTERGREAAFKCAEIFFEAGRYAFAEMYFKRFRLDYPVGMYSDTALFFEAQCRHKQGDITGAVFLFADLERRFVNSAYRFAAMKMLLSLYREQGEYLSALQTGSLIRQQYAQEFAAARLDNDMRELEVLASGIDKKTAQALFDWQNAGKNTTRRGRQAGFDLAGLYASDSGKQNEALKLLHDLDTELQKQGTKEVLLHANVFEKLAVLYRNKGECKIAGSFFLKAAERFSADGSTVAKEQSAKMLYGAAEAFDCAGMTGDAAAVYGRMQKDFAASLWTERARNFAEKQ